IEYFQEHVRPLLHPDAHFVGEADADTKRRLLRGALALINPIRWAEPFGMVMIEALACGTPVIATPHGAAPEIVEHGITGFLCTTDDEFLDAIARAPGLDRRHCRESVARRFSVERMVKGYLRVYHRLVGTELAPAGGAPLAI